MKKEERLDKAFAGWWERYGHKSLRYSSVKLGFEEGWRAAVGRSQMNSIKQDDAKELREENAKLLSLVKMGEAVVEDFLPNIKNCALQDIGRLNQFLLQTEQLARETNETKT